MTGALLWNFRDDLHIDASPALSGDLVYIASGVSRRFRKTEALCLEASTGQVRWRRPCQLPGWGSPLVVANRVYLGMGNGRLLASASPPDQPAGALLCLDADTGGEVFRFATRDAVLARAAAGAGRIYFASRDEFVYSLDEATGEIVWRYRLRGPSVTSPSLFGERLYAAPIRGPVVCLDTRRGSLLSSFDVEKWAGTEVRLLSSPVLAVDKVDGVDSATLYLGAELRGPLGSSAVLYALQASP
jgi:outer membrane protein assembly factor BamB